MQADLINKLDWDYLIVLDACRYDSFCEVTGYEPAKVISSGSSTHEWFLNTFRKPFYDLTYVSGNPNINSKKVIYHEGFVIDSRGKFSRIVDVWDFGWEYIHGIGTVHPFHVYDEARRTKPKAIIHFLQPHEPFVFSRKLEKYFMGVGKEDRHGLRLWEALKKGEVSRDEVYEAYLWNLDWVWYYVEKLLDELEGRIIITSDHGQCFGEHGIYGHPPGVRVPELIEVPWLTV